LFTLHGQHANPVVVVLLLLLLWPSRAAAAWAKQLSMQQHGVKGALS
jgi:hypothetical protein